MALHGIEYEYEPTYEHDTASIQFRQYKPDFYLPKYRIYIEHFGINAQGQPPPFVGDPKRYLDGMEWKRQLHRSRGTVLVETFSYQAAAGTLLANLERALRARGVSVEPLHPDEVRKLITQEPACARHVSPLAAVASIRQTVPPSYSETLTSPIES